MIIERRTFLLSGSALGALSLSGCMESAAPVLSISAQAQPGMNTGPDGSDRPVTLTVLQMSGSGNFDKADIFALQNPQAAIGGELIKADQIVLAPGAVVSKMIAVQPGATVIGVTAGFRSPTGKSVRKKIAAPVADQGLMISVGSGGIAMNTV